MLKISGLTHKICLLALFITLLLGHFNINTLVKSTTAKEYLNLIHSEGFNPLILEATRVTESTTSCIDHILSNFVSLSTSGSIAIEIADLYQSLLFLSPFPNKLKLEILKGLTRLLFKKH